MPFTYPSAAELSVIEPELVARGAEGRLGLQLMPSVEKNTYKVRWRQKDSYFGLQAMRGMDGQPTRVQRIGESLYEYEPGVFGEFGEITEQELTARAENLNPVSDPIPVDEMVLEIDQALIGRELDRKESSIFSLLLDGILNITIDGPQGLQVVYKDSYPIQTYTSPVSVADATNSTPIRYFQTMQQMGQPSGISVDFGTGATFHCNSVTTNAILNNLNAADLFGKRIGGGNTPNDLNDVNKILQALGLPKIQTYDWGYLTAPKAKGGKYKKFIPDYRGILVGARPGNATIGNYIVTRNASNGHRPGSYTYTIDRANGTNGEKRTPANIERHRGHNGGPVIYYPSAVIAVQF